MTTFLTGVTFLGSPEFIVPATFVLAALLFWKHRFHYLASFLFALIGSQLTVLLLKYYVNAPRPFDPMIVVTDPFSFPSGHANIAIVFYLALVFFLNRKYVTDTRRRYMLWGIALLLVLLVGMSRVYLRVHYIEDVVVGYLIGALWLFISSKLFLRHPDPKKSLSVR